MRSCNLVKGSSRSCLPCVFQNAALRAEQRGTRLPKPCVDMSCPRARTVQRFPVSLITNQTPIDFPRSALQLVAVYQAEKKKNEVLRAVRLANEMNDNTTEHCATVSSPQRQTRQCSQHLQQQQLSPARAAIDGVNTVTNKKRNEQRVHTRAAALPPSLSFCAISALSAAISAADLPPLPTSSPTGVVLVGLQIFTVLDRPLDESKQGGGGYATRKKNSRGPGMCMLCTTKEKNGGLTHAGTSQGGGGGYATETPNRGNVHATYVLRKKTMKGSHAQEHLTGAGGGYATETPYRGNVHATVCTTKENNEGVTRVGTSQGGYALGSNQHACQFETDGPLLFLTLRLAMLRATVRCC